MSVSQSRPLGLSRRTSMLGVLLVAGATLLGTAPQARADDGQVILATGLGAVAGALIGHSVGGRNGTIIGGAVGAAIGASAATEGGRYRGSSAQVVVSGYPTGYYEESYAPIAPVVYAQPVQIYRPIPIYQPSYQPVYQPIYQPVYRSVPKPVIYPVAYYGAYNSGYDSDDRRRQGRGWDNNRRDGRYDRDNSSWDSDRGNSVYRR